MKIELGDTVYHQDIYNGREPMKVVGIRFKEIELEGDYSGGTHNVCQKSWMPLEGILATINVVINVPDARETIINVIKETLADRHGVVSATPTNLNIIATKIIDRLKDGTIPNATRVNG